jgi:hypothetical protein
LIGTEHSHEAADVAVRLARDGQVDALMKGSLHTDELMHAAVAPRTGLATGRRMSHVFVMEVPAYPRLLFITCRARPGAGRSGVPSAARQRASVNLKPGGERGLRPGPALAS